MAIFNFSQSNFGYSDPDGDPMKALKIVTLPTVGVLKFNGTNVTANQIILVTQQIGNLTFEYTGDQISTPLTTFTFQVQDSQDSWSTNTATMSINTECL
jgi:ABC-type antimicrobial peptide transport system permease subunit